jgi:hypothetical protein
MAFWLTYQFYWIVTTVVAIDEAEYLYNLTYGVE